MIKNVTLLLIGSFVVALSMLCSQSIHIPLGCTMLVALALGYLEPKKGWVSAIILVSIIFGIHFCLPLYKIMPKNIESETFATYISALPALFGGLMGSYFNKTFKS